MVLQWAGIGVHGHHAMGRIFATRAMVGIAMCMYIYANIDTNTYTNTYANFIDCKGGAAEGRPPL